MQLGKTARLPPVRRATPASSGKQASDQAVENKRNAASLVPVTSVQP